MKRHIVASAVLLAALAGCDNGDAERVKQLQQRVSQLDTEVTTLRAELDDERNGPEKMLGQAKSQLQAKAFVEAKGILERLVSRHPGTAQAGEASTLLQQVESAIAAEQEAERLARKQKEAQAKAAMAKLDKNLVKKTDEFNGITWVTHKNEPVLAQKMALYFGMKENSADTFPLRLKFQYYSDSWLFVRKVSIKADEQTFALDGLDFKRDNSGGSIWEWSDNSVSDFKMLDAVLSAKKVLIRFDGQQYYSDFTLPEAQKTAMRDIVLAGAIRRQALIVLHARLGSATKSPARCGAWGSLWGRKRLA